jgi:YjeF-related protein N-terminus
LQRSIAALPSPPEIILDGLFGYLHSLDDIWDDEDKVTCVQLIKWANSLRGRRISIDKPAVAKSLLDDDVNVAVAAEWIVEVGALKDDLTVDKGERVFVVDLGLGKNVWKGVSGTGSGKKRMGINWNSKWAVEVEIVV